MATWDCAVQQQRHQARAPTDPCQLYNNNYYLAETYLTLPGSGITATSISGSHPGPDRRYPNLFIESLFPRRHRKPVFDPRSSLIHQEIRSKSDSEQTALQPTGAAYSLRDGDP